MGIMRKCFHCSEMSLSCFFYFIIESVAKISNSTPLFLFFTQPLYFIQFFIFSTLTQVGAYPVDPFIFSTIIFLAWWISARCNSIPSWSTLSRIPLSIHCGRVTSSAPSISTCAFLLHHACWQKDLEVEDFAEVLAIGSQKVAQGVHLKPLPHTDTHLRS